MDCKLSFFIVLILLAFTIVLSYSIWSSRPRAPKSILVYVCGAVAKPGVYELEPDSRIKDAIAAAGGVSPDADLYGVNLAKKLRDGDMVRVPSKKEPELRVNLNEAGVDEIAKLPGVSKDLAREIVKYRIENGPYLRLSELLRVKGMTFRKLESMRPYIEL